MPEQQQKNEAELEIIYNAVAAAATSGLMTEIIWSSMHALKSNPDLSIEQAIQIGLNEWDI